MEVKTIQEALAGRANYDCCGCYFNKCDGFIAGWNARGKADAEKVKWLKMRYPKNNVWNGFEWCEKTEKLILKANEMTHEEILQLSEGDTKGE